jgi:ABC-type glycerol-3-phosphate transport system substrate-binding protein
MLVATLAACGSEDPDTPPPPAPVNPNEPTDPVDPPDPADPGDDPTGPEPNEWGWIVPEQTLEITVWGGEFDPVTFAEDENGGGAVMDAFLLEQMNVKLNWVGNSNDRTEQLNLMLASNDYPEVLTAVPDLMADTFASQGRLVDLAPYLDTNLSNVSRRIGDLLGLFKTDDGALYKLPNMWGEQPDAVGADFGIRYDMWSETGLPMYNTPEQYYEALKAVLELYPENDAGERTYALSVPWNDGLQFLRPMLWAYGLTPEFYQINGDNSFSYWLFTDAGREVSLLVNRMFREGMIDPDYLSRTYDDYIAMLSTGRVIGNLGTWWVAFVGGHESWAADDPPPPIEKRFMNAAVTGGGIPFDETFLFQSNFLRNDRAIVTDECTQVVAVLDFINWMNSELGNLVIGWGVPGPDNFWNIDDAGNWVIKDHVIENMNVDKNTVFHEPRGAHGAIRYPISICRGTLRSDGRSDFSKLDPRVILPSIYDFWPWNPNTDSFLDAGINISWGSYKAPARDVLVYATTWDPDEAVTVMRESVIAENGTWWANIVTASSEEACLQALEDAKAAATALGISDIEASYADQYAVRSARMG